MYVVFEGIDDSGKTTQMGLVKKKLDLLFADNDSVETPKNIILISEPEIKIDADDNVELALLYAAQRRHIHNKMDSCFFKPRCNSIVLSDRSFYSSLAYQGFSSDFQNWIRIVNKFIDVPQLVFFFDKGNDDVLLNYAYNNYFSVLPFDTIHVNTDKYNIEDTTSFIANKIIDKWLYLRNNSF